MAKVGIMSMQRIINYGSYLQAYALKKMIESLGHNVEFIDFKFEKTVVPIEKETMSCKLKRYINIFEMTKKLNFLNKYRKVFNNNYLPELGVMNMNYNKDIDTLVIGSDEVFNCLQDYPIGFSRDLFGYGYEKSNVISYAASFGHTTLESLEKYNISNEISGLLKKFKSISVRDNNSKKIIEKLINVKPSIHLDPVLVYDFKERKKVKIDYKDYIIVYTYPGRLTKKEEKYIKDFAKSKNKKIMAVGFYQKIADYNIIAHPLEVFSYFEKADYVITDTFHGVIFSIKAKTKFCVLVRNSNKNKIKDLLSRLFLTSREANSLDKIEKLYNENIDYDIVYKKLKEEQKNTINYLKENI